MGNKRNKRQKETALAARRRCKAASDVRSALRCPPIMGHSSRSKAASEAMAVLGTGIHAKGITVGSVRSIFVINLDCRQDRMKKIEQRINSLVWHEQPPKIFRVPAADPNHPLLERAAKYGAAAKYSVANSLDKRNKCRACVLSHILALLKLENVNLTPALICEDDLILTEEKMKMIVPLPARAVAVSVGHDPAVTLDSPIVYEIMSGAYSAPIVAAKERGYKSSSAGYLIQTRKKSQELRQQLQKELSQGLSAPMDALLFHPRLFEGSYKGVYLTKEPLFTQDSNSWSSIESLLSNTGKK